MEEEGETSSGSLSPTFSPSLSPWVIRDRKLLFYTGVVFLAIIVAGILQEELGWSLLGLEPVYSRSASNVGVFLSLSPFLSLLLSLSPSDPLPP